MSKSSLEVEVDQLQANAAFLSDFLDVSLYNLSPAKEQPTANPPQATAQPQAPATVSPVEKKVAKPAETVAAEPAATLPIAPAVVTKIVMTKAAAAVPPKKNYAGKYVIWTPQPPSPVERILIKKIIEAVRIPASSLSLETATTTDHADWSTTPFVFAFGIAKLPGTMHSVNSWEGTKLLNSCSLATLNADVNQKKALWASLKQAFKI